MLFEIVNTENGAVLCEIEDKKTALLWAQDWSEKNSFDYLQISETERLITIVKYGSEYDMATRE